MSSTETKRPRVPTSDVKIGTVLFTDDGFTCMDSGKLKTVYRDGVTGQLFVTCTDGRHYLDGQETDDGHYVGFRLG